MKSSTRSKLTTFLNMYALYGVSAASAWSCGPTISSSFGVISSPYSNVGCRPNENCGPSSYTDIFTIPDIQSMQRRRRKQRDYYRQLMNEFRNMNQPMSPWTTRSTPRTFSPRYDITESDIDVKINMDVPGIDMNNIGITLDNETKILTVSGSRDITSSKTDDENGSRSFTQKFVVKNPAIDINEISAQLENGVLTITLQKFQKQEIKESNIRTIPIMSSISPESATPSSIDDTITNNTSESTSDIKRDDEVSIDETTVVAADTSNNVSSSSAAATLDENDTTTNDSDTNNSNDESGNDKSNDAFPTV